MDFHAICQLNGIDEGVFSQRVKDVTRLEFFMVPTLTVLPSLIDFPSLKEIHFISCPVRVIQHLEYLHYLEKLYIIEASLTSLSGLPSLQLLSHLFLYSNKISSISNFPLLPSLTFLDLSGNRLTTLSNLSHSVPNLISLNIADNQFSSLIELISFKKLESLNVSGNLIYHVLEFRHLCQLKYLNQLHVSDQKYHVTPVSQSNNLKVCLIAMLPNLSFLDSTEITEEDVLMAEVQFVRKRAFYSLKAHYLKISAQNLVEKCRKMVFSELRKLDLEDSVTCKLSSTHNQQSNSTNDCRYLELFSILNCFEQSLSRALSDEISRCWIEFESAGNVKFENFVIDNSSTNGFFSEILGTVNRNGFRVARIITTTLLPASQNFTVDPVSSPSRCAYLPVGDESELSILLSQLPPNSTSFLNVSNIPSFLAKNFTTVDCVKLAIYKTGVCSTLLLGFAFITPAIDTCQDPDFVQVANLFPNCLVSFSECVALQSKKSINSTPINSLTLSVFNSQNSVVINSSSLNTNMISNQIKKLVINFCGIKDFSLLLRANSIEFLDVSYNSLTQIAFPIKLPRLEVLIAKGNNISSINESSKVNANHVISIDLRGNPITEFPRFIEILKGFFHRLKQINLFMISPCSFKNLDENFGERIFHFERPFSERSRILNHVTSIPTILNVKMDPSTIIELDLSNCMLSLDTSCSDFLQKLSNIRIMILNQNEIQSFSFLRFLPTSTSVQHLSLSHNRLSSFDSWPAECIFSINYLDLSFNEFISLTLVPKLNHLKYFNLSFNPINSLSGIEIFQNLTEFYLSFSNLSDLNALRHLRKLPRLQILDLNFSPCMQDPECFLSLIFSLKRLKALNGNLISEEDKGKAISRFNGRLTKEMLVKQIQKSANVNSTTTFVDSIISNLTSLDLSGLGLKHLFALTLTSLESPSFPRLTDLHLEHNNLKTTDDLALAGNKFPNLKSLFLSFNRFSAPMSLHGILSFKSVLIELDLSDCQIPLLSQIPIHQFNSLKKLSLAGNGFTTLDSGIFSNTKLTHLDLSRNEITSISTVSFTNSNILTLNLADNSLRTLSGLIIPSLINLDLSANRISDSYEINRISSNCSNISNLDISNNPLSRKNLYRSLCISAFSHLNILDKIVITNEERSQLTSNLIDKNVKEVSTVKVPLKISNFSFDNIAQISASKIQFHP
ncbi:hypothetical protein RCL1_001557 [Eukaryota sp. TZLM3-RCL]